MPYDTDLLRKQSKKNCFMCKSYPQNILMLACNDSVCLQCAYKVLKQSSIRYQSREEIEFKCQKCNQVTYFDRDLIKQIESSIRPQKVQIKSTSQFHSMKNQRNEESFIQKMKRQYLGDESKFLKQNVEYKKEFLNQTFDSNQKKTENFQKNRFSLTNQFFQANQMNFKSNQRLSKQNKSKLQQSYFKKVSSLTQQNTKCKTHSYYELIYYCVQCQQIVCSQCLLRGKHRDHKNESITEILQHELPNFINKTSQKLLVQINRVQNIKDIKYSQLKKRIQEIMSIRQNAFEYFHEVKRNIEKQEKQVLERCDQLMQNLRKEQNQIETQQKEIQTKLAEQIKEIKSLKSSYKEFLDSSNEKSNKGIQKSLIQRFIKCTQNINELFLQKNENKQIQKQDILRNSFQRNNGVNYLNKKIQESIQSIRQSLVFDNYSQQFNNLIKEQKKNQQNDGSYQQSRLSFMKPCLNKKISEKPPTNSYISYLSTDNSPNRNKYFKKQQKSLSISPYKGESLFQTSNHGKINISKKKHTIKQVCDIEKQNICIQPHQKQSKATKLSSQASSQNVSSKKYTNQSKNSSISKSKNNSITKKRHPKINNNHIAKFQV